MKFTYYLKTLAYDTYMIHKSIKTVAVIAGFILLGYVLIAFLAWFWRKQRRELLLWFAQYTAKIHFETKLFLWFFAIVFALNIVFGNLLYASPWNSALELINAAYIAFTIIIISLLINDLRFNNKISKHSIFAALHNRILKSGEKLTVQKRLLRGAFCLCACTIWFSFGLFIILFSLFVRLSPFILLGIFMMATSTLGIIYLEKIKRTVSDIGTFIGYINELCGGKTPECPKFIQETELQNAANKLSELEKTLQLTISEKMKAENMKIELVANVSHDIKTPLTSVISYIDLLKQEDGLPTHVNEYITILDEKSQRLKNMVQDIFEVSRAAGGQLPVNVQTLDLSRLLRQTLADMQENILESGLEIIESIPNECYVSSDGDRMYRVYQNLIANALKYSMQSSRVYVSLSAVKGKAIVSVKNMSAQPLSGNVDFTARFVRGDSSRTDGGSGLGLSIAESFTSACSGVFKIEVNADLFCAYTEFDIVQQ